MKRASKLWIAAGAGLLGIALAAGIARSVWTHRPEIADFLTPTHHLASSVKIPFALDGNHIYFNVSLNGSRPLWFILDTGGTGAIVDLDVAQELGLKLAGEGVMGGAGSEAAASRTVEVASFTIPGLTEFSQPVEIAVPLHKALGARMGRDVDGIVGGDFIKKFVVELDYKARTIVLHDRSTFTYAGPGESVPIVFDAERQPMIRASVTPAGGGPIGGLFKIDTGGGIALTLHSPFVAEHHLPGAGVKTMPIIGPRGVAGDVAGKYARLAELKIGPFAFPRPVALFSFDQAGSFANPAIQGNIGGAVLSRFRVFLDYKHGRIIFEPAAGMGEPVERAFIGMALEASGADYKTFRVDQVLPDSAASEGGVIAGDIVAAVDGRPAKELTLSEINEMCQRPGERAFKFSRGGQVVDVRVTPRTLE